MRPLHKTKTNEQIRNRVLPKMALEFGLTPSIIVGFGALNQKLSLEKLSDTEKELFFVHFFRAVYARLAKKFRLSVSWSDQAVIPEQLKKELAAFPEIDKHYVAAVEKLQQEIVGNL